MVSIGEKVHFINKSNLASVKYKWKIEGADKESTTAKNPTVSFAKAGTYSVSLTAVNNKGKENKVTQKALITVVDKTVELTNFCSQ